MKLLVSFDIGLNIIGSVVKQREFAAKIKIISNAMKFQ
jgi:hypothetical protein